jgi:hypothetical protein
MRRRFPFRTVFAAVILAAPVVMRADELKLKDGTKIIGTIVGYEENSFKVKTNYGFAVVQKDQVLSITISDSTKKPDAEKKSEPAAEKSAPTAKGVNSYSTNAASSAVPAAKPESAHAVPNAPPAPAVTAKAAPPIAAAPPPSPPPKPAPPEPMREQVSGNLYTNETYGFHMYKPPTWELVEGARSVLPGAITALGTSDQTTYLLIGQQPVGKSLASDIEATDHHLRDTLDNYRPLGEKKLTVSGLPAVEHRFRVSVDQRDWSGVVVFFQRDKQLYTIFGMTFAGSDLVQIQENVIARAISSLQFTNQ